MAELMPEELQAVARLLEVATQAEVGLVFEPDDDGWIISYASRLGAPGEYIEWTGNILAKTYDLRSAAEAALRPLRDIVGLPHPGVSEAVPGGAASRDKAAEGLARNGEWGDL